MVKGSSAFSGAQALEYNSAVDGPHRDITYPFTMTGYIYVPGYATTNDKYLFSMTDGTGGGVETAIALGISGKTPFIAAGDGTGFTKSGMTELASYNTWYYLTLVVNSATDRSFYVGGVFDAKSTANRDVVAQKANMNFSSIGEFVTTSGTALLNDGLEVYVQFYNDGLTTGEMASQMADPSNILDNCIWAPDLQVDSSVVANYTDLSGSGYTPNGGTAPFYHLRNPIANYGAGCIDFQGQSNDSYITMGSFSGLDGVTGASFAVWINFNTLENNKSLSAQYNGFSNSNWFHSTENTKYNLTLKKTTGGATNFRVARSQNTLGTLFSTGTWVHMCWTWKSNANTIADFTLYKDGTSISIESGASNGTLDAIGSLGPDFELGALNLNFFNIDAKIAHHALYDKELTEKEVKAIRLNPDAIITNRVSYIPGTDWNFRDLETRAVPTDFDRVGFSLRDESPPYQ